MKLARITQLLFIPTGQYHDLALRPYSIDRNNPLSMDQLHASTDGFRDLTPTAMTRTASQILAPSAMPMGTIHIENGWREKRFMFIMTVEHGQDYDMSDSSVRVQYITGQTDFADPSFSGRVDPQMRMYLDAVINTREVRQNNQMFRRGISSQFYLASAGRDAGYQQSSTLGRWSMRPRDLINQIGNASYSLPVENDYRNSLMTGAKLSEVANNLPSDYLSRTLKSYKLTMNSEGIEQSDESDIMYRTGNLTGDAPLVEDAFLLDLQRNTDLAEGQCLTFGQLCSMFPEALGDEVTVIAPDSGPMTRDIGFHTHNPNDSNDWNGSGPETMAATIMAQSLPALMHMHLLTHVAFTITNDTHDGRNDFRWLSEPKSFMNTGVSLNAHAESFIGRLIGEVFPAVTRNGNMTVTIAVFSDLLFADTRIRISVDYGPDYEYAPPNFAGSLMAPVIANNASMVENLSSSIGAVFRGMRPSSIDVPPQNLFTESNFMAGSNMSLREVVRDRDSPNSGSFTRNDSATPSTNPYGRSTNTGGWKI